MSCDDITGGANLGGMVLEDDGDSFWEDLPGSADLAWNHYMHGVLVPHFTQKEPLLTCPGTCKSRCKNAGLLVSW